MWFGRTMKNWFLINGEMFVVRVIYWFCLIKYPTWTNGYRNHQTLTHVNNPVQLSVGECITLRAETTYDVQGEWVWSKDTIVMRTTSRINLRGDQLVISDADVEDSAYYSAEVLTQGGKELFRFWINVKGCRDNERKTRFHQGQCKSWCQKKCKETWIYYEDHCYKYFDAPKTWSDALDGCQANDAQLAVVENDKTNKFVASLLGSGEGAWIGLNDRKSESNYIWNNEDDTKVGYFKWDTNEPSNTNSRCNVENCIEMKHVNLKWNDMSCTGYNAFVCEWNKCDFNSGNVTCSCYNDKCYQYFSLKLIWRDAQIKCQELGGDLVKITDLATNIFLGTIIHSNIWIGLNDIAEPGLYIWRYSSINKLNDKALFFNWDKGEPNDKLYDQSLEDKCSGEDCVQINTWENDVRWRDIECSNKLPYVCEEARSSLLGVAAALGISLGCTAVFIIITALIQFRFKSRKNNVQLQQLVFK